MQRISWDGLEERLKGRYFKLHEVKEFVDAVISRKDALMIILFGSLAEGKPVRSSDADMIIILDHNVDFLPASIEFRKMDTNGIIEAFPYSMESFQRMILDVNQIAWDAVEKGLILYDSGNIQSDIEDLVEDVRGAKGVTPVENGYKLSKLLITD